MAKLSWSLTLQVTGGPTVSAGLSHSNIIEILPSAGKVEPSSHRTWISTASRWWSTATSAR